MRRGRPTRAIELSGEDKEQLERISRMRKAGVREVERARIILLCAEGKTNVEVADELDLSLPCVGKWRQRFIDSGIKALGDLPRAGAPRTISDQEVARVVEHTLNKKPKDATHWSTRTLASKMGYSHRSIARIWKAFGLKPHLHENFTLSSDPLFVEKVRDVVGLYMSPPQNAVVFCIDEKSQIQALERSQPVLPMSYGRKQRHTHDYFRHGTCSLFAALEVATGKVIGTCRRKHTHKEFIEFLKQIEDQVPEGLEIHAVLDNYATHKTDAVVRWLARHPRWNLHFIPTHSSWLNQVERFFAELTRKKLRRSSFNNLASLKEAILDYIENHNQHSRFPVFISARYSKVKHLCNELVLQDTRPC